MRYLPLSDMQRLRTGNSLVPRKTLENELNIKYSVPPESYTAEYLSDADSAADVIEYCAEQVLRPVAENTVIPELPATERPFPNRANDCLLSGSYMISVRFSLFYSWHFLLSE